MSRMGRWYQTRQAIEFRALAEFAKDGFQYCHFGSIAVQIRRKNGVSKMFDALQIKRYEIVHEKADFYDRQEVGIVRPIAVKP
jgi:hypothetical protein